MIESFFAVKPEHKTLFCQLPLEAKKAIITRWGLECEGLEGLIQERFFEKDVLTDVDWQVLIKDVEESKGGIALYLLDVPTAEVKEIILTNLEDGDFTTWEEYSAWYGLKDVPDHPKEDRWPCLSCSGDDEVFEDGWHRLHSYVNNAHESIPVLIY